jgi:hypothetical protein
LVKRKIIYEIGEENLLQALSQAQEEISSAALNSRGSVVKSKLDSANLNRIKSHKQSI